MKKIAIYLFLACLLSLQTACVDDKLLTDSPSVNDGNPIALSVNMMLPNAQSVATVTTRALEGIPENPGTDYLDKLNLYVFVFEDMGSRETNYLRELVYGSKIESQPAESDDQHDGKQNVVYRKFNITLEGTSENAIIHLVATSDPTFEEQLAQITDRSELGIFSGESGLYTSGKYEAYWKRIKLEMPISTGNISKIQSKLSHVMMTRNFACLSLTVGDLKKTGKTPAEAQDFVLDGYELVNVVNSGYVAAYSEANRTFVEFEQNGEPVTYQDLTMNKNYTGSRHPHSTREHPDDDTKWLEEEYQNETDWNTNAKYTFERPYQNQHRTYVLVKGHFKSANKTRYIKLDIGAINGNEVGVSGPFGVFETYNLLRNISYKLTITDILSTEIGYETAEEALVGPPANNVATSVETGSLLNIYDGIDHMQVNTTRIVIVDSDGGDPYPATAEIKWRYFKNYRDSDGGTLDNNVIRWDYPGYDFTMPDPSGIIYSWLNKWDEEFKERGPVRKDEYLDKVGGSILNYGDVTEFEADDDKGNWLGFKLKFNPPDDVPRQKTIRLFNPYGLSRDITLIMRKRWSLVNNTPETPNEVEVYPGHYSFEDGTMPAESMQEMREKVTPGKIGSHRGAALTVMFELPADLPQAIFPLDFTIEADRQNIENAYVGNAVVTSGKSLFENVSATRIQFVKTVTWEYYNGSGDYNSKGHRIVTARFLTTTDVQMVGSVENDAYTRVRVSNPYFFSGNDTFQRESFEDVVDPTRKQWYWRFSDTEWLNYHNNTTGQFGAGALNDLHFAAHTFGKQGEGVGGQYMAIATADGGTISSPALSFAVDIPTEKLQGTLIIDATSSEKDSKSDRYIYIGAMTESGRRVTSLENPKSVHSRSYDLQTLTFDISKISANGETIKQILIWSTPATTANIVDVPTRFFAVIMTLEE